MNTTTVPLRAFLDARRVTDANWNLTGMAGDVGKYRVSDDDYGELLRLHYEHVFVAGRHSALLERHSATGSPILIDLDFRWAPPLTERRYTADGVGSFITQYIAALHRFFVCDCELRFYVQETPAPRQDGDVVKDGIHVVCPDINMRYEDMFILRKYVLEQGVVRGAFPDLMNRDDDCFDEAVIKRNNWFLYGASKITGRPAYAVTRCFVLAQDGTVTEERVCETAQECVCMFSIRTATASDYTVRPDMMEEWNTWKSICDKKPKPKTTDIIVHQDDDTNSVHTHMSEQISRIIKQPGLVWTVAEVDDGYKLSHNSKRCLVADDVEHSAVGHSCVFVTQSAANLVCFSHKSKRLPKPMAVCLWNVLSGTSDANESDVRYEVLKANFEKHAFRILDPPGYMVYITDKWVHYNRAQLIDMNSGVFVDDERKERFIDRWLRDCCIRTYARMDYYVDVSDCPHTIYNMFEGFAAQQVQGDAGDIAPILVHIELLCNHDMDAMEFFLDWLASTVQMPGRLNGIALVILGTHGCGKDMLLTWFGSKVIGMANYFKTARPHVDLFSAFNSSRKNVIFYHIEEANSTTITPSNVEQFKNYMTDPYASIQIKNKNTTSTESLVKNYNHFAVTSNFNVPFHIEKTERRIFAVKASSEKYRNFQYFSSLAVVMEDPSVAKGFYEFLMGRDIRDRDWCNPPMTEALRAWKAECMPKLEPFVEWFKTTNNDREILSSKFYAIYLEWCSQTEEEPLSIRYFGMELKNINGISKSHSSNGTNYTIV